MEAGSAMAAAGPRRARGGQGQQQEEGAVVTPAAPYKATRRPPTLGTNEQEKEQEQLQQGARQALALAAAAARLLKAHGPALAAAKAAGAGAGAAEADTTTIIPSTEEERGGGLASLWELKRAIDGLLLEAEEGGEAPVVPTPAQLQPPALSITIPPALPSPPASPLPISRSLSAASSTGADALSSGISSGSNGGSGGIDTLSAMHPGLPRGNTPPRPTSSSSSGGVGSAAAAAVAAVGSCVGRRGHKSPRLHLLLQQQQRAAGAAAEEGKEGQGRCLGSPPHFHRQQPQHEQEQAQPAPVPGAEADDTDEDGESAAAAASVHTPTPTGVWTSGAAAFDAAAAGWHHPLYRRWGGAPSARAAVTATPDLLAHTLGFLVPTAHRIPITAATAGVGGGAGAALGRYRWGIAASVASAPAPVVAVAEAAGGGATGGGSSSGGSRSNDEEGPRAACRTLGAFALVSRLWLTAARRAHFWRPILATRLPVLALQLQEQEARAEKQQRRQRRREEEDEESEAGGMAGPFLPLAHSHSASSAVSILSLSPPRRGGVGKRRGSCGGWEDPEAAAEAEAAEGNGGNGSGSGSGGSNVYFASLRAYGESVLRRQSLLEGALPRYGDLVLGFEVWDAADGLRLLSASGPFCVVPIEGTILLRLTGRHRREVVGPPFSAASRDPGQERYKSMGDFFLRQAEPQLPSAVHIRATMTCRRTGRTTLIWESGKEARMKIQSPSPSARAFLPPRSFFVRTVGWTPVNLLGGIEWDSPVAVAAREDQAARGSPLLEARVGFYLQPAPAHLMPNGGEGLDQREKLWRLAGGDEERYDEHGSFIRLGFNTDDVQLVGRFLQSLLG